MKSVYEELLKIQKNAQDSLKEIEQNTLKRPQSLGEKITSARYRGVLWHSEQVKKLLDKVGL